MHPPLVQVSDVLVQPLLHAPQLALSVPVLTQLPLQFMVLLGQPQAPAVQAMPPVQALPQPPQLLASVWVLTLHPSEKLPLQLAEPAAHAVTWQVPPLHATPVTLVPGVQVMPQPPQLLGSLVRSAQLPLQLVWVLGQAVEQTLLEQTWPAGQGAVALQAHWLFWHA